MTARKGQVIDGEATPVEEPGEALMAPQPPSAPLTLFGTHDPAGVIERSSAVATALAAVLTKQGLTSSIQNKNYVRVEGWTLLGSMLGVFPVLEWTRKLDNGWEARVEARTLSGAVIGAAEASCLRSESKWSGRDDYALRSMAQTRATAKALRQPLGFIVALAGYDATPAEEIPEGHETPAAATQGTHDPAATSEAVNPEPGPPTAKDYTWAEATILLRSLKQQEKLNQFYEVAVAGGFLPKDTGLTEALWKTLDATTHITLVDLTRTVLHSKRAA